MTTEREAVGGRADHCITCSDEAVAMTVLQVDNDGALALCATVDGSTETIDVSLVAPVRSAECLLIHAGTAIARQAGTL